jgi:molybdenum cofactor cytidylyltransferase
VTRDSAALILAAGSARRFGGDKRQALGAWNGPLLHHVLSLYRPLFAQLAVVTVAADDFGDAACRQFGARRLINPAAECGMGSSLAVGIEWLVAGGFAGVVVGLADMPWIAASTIAAVRDALSRDACAVAPAFGAELGFPRGIPAADFARLRGLDGDRGAGALLEWRRLACGDSGILRDIDRPDDVGETS